MENFLGIDFPQIFTKFGKISTTDIFFNKIGMKLAKFFTKEK